MKRIVSGLSMCALIASGVVAQNAHQTAVARDTRNVDFRVEPVPFGPGEHMEYQAKYGIFGTVGSGSLRVEGIDTVRGEPTYKLAFRVKGRITFWSLDDVQRSWLDVEDLYAHRFEQKLNQSTYKRDRVLDFLPDEMRWVREGKPEENGELATDAPLDDVSFLYFVRTLPLEVGETYTLPRYYKDEGNPVVVRVLRTEKIRVPAGEFETVVVRPIIRTDGMFGEGGQAEVWFTNDERRVLVRLEAKQGPGTLRMELSEYTPGTRLVQGRPAQPSLDATR